MLRSVYTKTVRDLRWGTLGWGLGVGILTLVTAIGWSIAYPDQADRQRFAATIEGALSAGQVMYGEPHNLATLGGFLEWRALGLAPVLLGLYAILAATGQVRGSEDSYAAEVVLASPVGRRRVFLQRAAALATALGLAVLAIAILTVISGPVSGEPVIALHRVAGMALNLWLAAGVFAALGLLTSQLFVRRRNAALVATGAMAAAHLLNTLPLLATSLGAVRDVTPLRLYSESTPLSTGHASWWALLSLATIVAGLTGGAYLLSERRDTFNVFRWRELAAQPSTRHIPRSGPATPRALYRTRIGRALHDNTGSAAAWGFALGLIAVLIILLTPNIREAIAEQSGSNPFSRLNGSDREILSAMLFTFLLPPLVAVFSITLAAAWAGDETAQRMEVELSTPSPRWRVFVGRFAAATAGQAATLAVVAIAALVAIRSSGVHVPGGAVVSAAVALAALGALVIAFGFAAAAWRPGAAAAAAGLFVAVMYFGQLVVPLLGLPGWTDSVTIFGLYGEPLADGFAAWRVFVLLGLAAAIAAAGAVRFQRRDIVR